MEKESLAKSLFEKVQYLPQRKLDYTKKECFQYFGKPVQHCDKSIQSILLLSEDNPEVSLHQSSSKQPTFTESVQLCKNSNHSTICHQVKRNRRCPCILATGTNLSPEIFLTLTLSDPAPVTYKYSKVRYLLLRATLSRYFS